MGTRDKGRVIAKITDKEFQKRERNLQTSRSPVENKRRVGKGREGKILS